MFDFKVKEFKEKIVKEVNDSGLPATIIFYVLKELTESAANIAQHQAQQQEQSQEQGKDKETADIKE